MLFIFDQTEVLNFWMKDTFIPLDIAFFDDKAMLKKITQMPTEKNPEKPEQIYSSDGLTKYALETDLGVLISFKNKNLKLCIKKN